MKYTQEYRIYENDVDFRKMATLGTLLRYCQQIGAEDAEHYGITPELYPSTPTSYVLAKLALHITRTPRVEETITVQTEPEAPAFSRNSSAARKAVLRPSVGISSRLTDSVMPFPALTTTVTSSAREMLCITVSRRW